MSHVRKDKELRRLQGKFDDVVKDFVIKNKVASADIVEVLLDEVFLLFCAFTGAL